MSPIHKINDQANTIICDQEEAISALKHKLYEMEDARDVAIGKALELVQALKRIECAADEGSRIEIKDIAMRAIDDFQGK